MHVEFAATLRRWATLNAVSGEDALRSAGSLVQELSRILERWAKIGVPTSPPPGTGADWNAVSPMVKALSRDVQDASTAIDGLLKRSSDRFSGLGDPLQVDFGAHRWLRGAREESYSDWLAWLLERQDDVARVFALLGLDCHDVAKGRLSAEREFDTPDGRFDILVRCGGCPQLVIEVKTTSELENDQLEPILFT